jgi:heme-degrading monooxygenase HmoA
MIIRQWAALAKKEAEAAYLRHFREEVMPKLRQLDGFLGATVLRISQAEGVRLTIQTRWRSLDAVRAFAGASLEQAVVAPEARDYFHHYDQTVSHHERAFEELR